jgi:hypothetical protein
MRFFPDLLLQKIQRMKFILNILQYKSPQKIILLFVLCLPAITGMAQGFDDEVTDVPIDGGLSLLVAAGVGYGAKQLKKKKKDDKLTAISKM